MALAEWGLRELLARAQALGATKPEHHLLPLSLAKWRYRVKGADVDWVVNKPMTSWVKSWRKLMEACGMKGFRFHDLQHYAESFRRRSQPRSFARCSIRHSPEVSRNRSGHLTKNRSTKPTLFTGKKWFLGRG